MPIIVALAIVAGMFINSLFIRKDIQNKRELFLPVQGSKMDMILNMINHSYVDTVDIKKNRRRRCRSDYQGPRPSHRLHSGKRPGKSQRRHDR